MYLSLHKLLLQIYESSQFNIWYIVVRLFLLFERVIHDYKAITSAR